MEMDKHEFQCEYGNYSHGVITTPDGGLIRCITYGSIRKEIQDTTGFFNLQWCEEIGEWIIFQYILEEVS